jgi:hypothetical protein
MKPAHVVMTSAPLRGGIGEEAAEQLKRTEQKSLRISSRNKQRRRTRKGYVNMVV